MSGSLGTAEPHERQAQLLEHMSSSPIYREDMQVTGGVEPVGKKLTRSRADTRMETEARPFRCWRFILLNVLFL